MNYRILSLLVMSLPLMAKESLLSSAGRFATRHGCEITAAAMMGTYIVLTDRTKKKKHRRPLGTKLLMLFAATEGARALEGYATTGSSKAALLAMRLPSTFRVAIERLIALCEPLFLREYYTRKLFEASAEGDIGEVRYLLWRGADARAQEGVSIHNVQVSSVPDWEAFKTHQAAFNACIEYCKNLKRALMCLRELADHGADVNAYVGCATPLHNAVLEDRGAKMVGLLLKLGAGVNNITTDGIVPRTPLDMLEQVEQDPFDSTFRNSAERSEVRKLLRDAGGKLNSELTNNC